ncbi:MAG: hypothetical protein FWD47_14875 [Treponema sp.]|nr:hypothetical protein [Treponema sp.]
MKKLLAIAVIFALVAGAAFAETAISGAVETRWGVAANSGQSGADTMTQGGVAEAYIQLSGENDEGTFGGLLRILSIPQNERYELTTPLPVEGESWEPSDTSYIVSGFDHHRAFVWWRPIEQVRIWLGQDPDGMFNTADLSRWGHHRGTRGVSVENWDAGQYLLGNWDVFGVVLSVFPVEGFEFHLAHNIPVDNTRTGNGAEISKAWEMIQIQASYAADFGKIYFTYKGAMEWWIGEKGVIGATFFSNSLVDGLAFEAGFTYLLDETANKSNLRIGLGAHYSLDDFGVRARIFMNPRENFFFLKADIMPFYSLDFGTIFCNFRLVTVSQGGDTKIGWHVNPYFVVNGNPGQFRAGLLLADETASENVSWAFNIGLLFAF